MKLCWIMFAVLAASLLLGADGAARRRRARHGRELELQRQKRLVDVDDGLGEHWRTGLCLKDTRRGLSNC